METVEFHDIEEDTLRSLLHEIPVIWKENSGFFDDGLKLVFKNIGNLDNLLFGVHIFTHKNGTKMFIILTEYFRDTQIATFNINARTNVGWLAPSYYTIGEEKFRTILENLTTEDLEMLSIKNLRHESDDIFVCPNCNAQYLMRVLQITEDVRIVCQNCNQSFDPGELDMARRANSNES